jgi:myotubularin-related protein 5/13
LIRINPKPVIQFHKASFLASRDFSDTDFLARVLDSMFFTTFISERGPPWRQFDAFDELYNSMPEFLKSESLDSKLMFKHIQEFAQKLYVNECPNIQNYQQKILNPTEGAFTRIHQPEFPKVDATLVQRIINEGMSKNELQTRITSLNRKNPRIIPLGPSLSIYNDGRLSLSHTVRKMEVIKNCVNCIFENKISDARKIFPAVIRILKQRDDARMFLCRELGKFVHGSNKAMLENSQFEMVCKLMNRALQDDSTKFQYEIAASLLPLGISFCRKLSSTAMQFAYTCIQGHNIWKTSSFWEQAFYQEVQGNIKNLYVKKPVEKNHQNDSSSFNVHKANSNECGVLQEPSALEIAAKQMMDWTTTEKEIQNELINSEEQILYSQALHYAHRMISLLVPLDVRSNIRVKKVTKRIDDDTSISNSVLESRSDQSADFFEDRDNSTEQEQSVIRTVCKFIDKVCNEGGINTEQIRKLHSIIPGLVDMQCDTLDTIYRELKRIPPVQKPKIQFPSLLMGEELIGEPIRAILIPDGREEVQCPILPAEGALFISNYRVIFKGMPVDSLSCEQSVVRSFPIASLTKVFYQYI